MTTWAALPFLALFGAFLPGPLSRRLRVDPALVAGAIAICGVFGLVVHAPAVIGRGETAIWSTSWVPALGLDLALRLDGLAFLMAAVILVIGVMVVLYARFYLKPSELTGRFFGPLLAFMGAMLGIALSENLLLLVVFWELTSISSFLLIGFWQHQGEARRGARMALAITGMGGLALLAGVVLVGHVVGSYELSVVFERAAILKSDGLYPAALGLILLGAFTKSAQFPFHFWLPHAMAAPTPISAYLHSATMVKAGIFLVARLHPALSGTPLFHTLVTAVGAATLLLGAFVAIFQHDLKGMLAYSTISHLGLIMMLLGLDTEFGPTAALLHLLNHAAFKAALFMIVGIVDHETGTRDLRRLGGLRGALPITSALAVVASASMAGLPLLNGFLSKEMFFTEVVAAGPFAGIPWLLPVIATLAGTFSVTYSIRFVYGTFFGATKGPLPREPHEPPHAMRLPVEIFVGVCVLVGLFPMTLAGDLVHAAATASTQRLDLPLAEIAIWHGFNLPLAMSGVAVFGGAALFLQGRALIRPFEGRLGISYGRDAFERLVAGLVGGSRSLERRLGTTRMATHLRWFLIAALTIALVVFLPDLAWESLEAPDFEPVTLGIGLLAAVAIVGVVRMSGRPLTAIIFLGVAGLATTLAFAWFSAPDLALTQLLVELTAILLLLVALPHLGRPPPETRTPAGQGLDLILSLGIGGVITLACWNLLSTDLSRISEYFLETSVPLAEGENVVNVILVDYRGFDTFGEVSVLTIAAVAILSLLDRLSRARRPEGVKPNTPMLIQTPAKLLLNLAFVTAAFLFIRGHDAPGGGFIAGLTAAVGLVYVYQARSPTGDPIARPGSMARWLGLAVLLAALTGVAAVVFGQPFLRASHAHLPIPVLGDVHLSSVLAFDLGVFVAVVAGVMAMLPTLGRIPVARPYRVEEEE